LRRAVAAQKGRWKRARRVYRPWTPEPGQHLLIDYGTVTHGPNKGLKIFTAVLAWSRWRFVRFTRDETLETTLWLLAECFEALGGVPAVVLADRMGCLKGGVVANVVVPTAAYVRFATHYGFRPFCEAHDPESKGAVEALVGAGKTVAVRAALAALDPARHTLIYLGNPTIGARGIHHAIVAALGGLPKTHMATLVPQAGDALATEAVERGRTPVLVLDEAHLLDHAQLEGIRMLTNYDMDSRSPFACLLIGQPTLRSNSGSSPPSTSALRCATPSRP
jgi:hypothetical protein